MSTISEFDLKKISYLLNASLTMVDKDHGSALVLLRKTLEKAIHSYYETMKIAKPISEEGYSVLSQLAKQLHEEEIINDEVFDSSEKVRRLGNKAAHYSNIEFKESDVEDAVLNVCRVINDLLHKFDAVNNSLFLLTLSRGDVDRQTPADERWTNNVGLIRELLSDKFVINEKSLIAVRDLLESNYILDEELREYLFELHLIHNKLNQIHKESPELQNRKDYFKKIIVNMYAPLARPILKMLLLDLKANHNKTRKWLMEKYKL